MFDRVTALILGDRGFGNGMRLVLLRTEVVEPIFATVWAALDAKRAAKS